MAERNLPTPDPSARLSRPARSALARGLVRAPIHLYRWGLGGLLGRRFVLLTHIGRRSGRPRQVVLEVVGRGPEPGVYVVASGYGDRAQWYRNVAADPRVLYQVGRQRHHGRADPLPAAESGRRLAAYARHHPRVAARLLSAIGQDVDGSDAGYERVGADAEHGIPLVALRPARPQTTSTTSTSSAR